jgi:hypothetical protein
VVQKGRSFYAYAKAWWTDYLGLSPVMHARSASVVMIGSGGLHASSCSCAFPWRLRARAGPSRSSRRTRRGCIAECAPSSRRSGGADCLTPRATPRASWLSSPSKDACESTTVERVPCMWPVLMLLSLVMRVHGQLRGRCAERDVVLALGLPLPRQGRRRGPRHSTVQPTVSHRRDQLQMWR